MFSRKVFLATLCLVFTFSDPIIIPIASTNNCHARCNWNNGGNYNPPNPPPPAPPDIPKWEGGGGPPRLGSPTAPAGPSAPGPSAPTGPQTPSGGGGGGPRGPARGAFTKKSRNTATTSATWEYWWARNRFHFVDVPDNAFEPRGPTTPSNNADQSKQDARRKMLDLAARTFRPFIDGSSSHLKRSSLVSLGRMNDGDSVEATIAQLGNRNATVQISAILGLGLSNNRKAQYTLLNILRDTAHARQKINQAVTPTFMRSFAGFALALGGSRGAGPLLHEIARDRKASNDLRAVALEALGLLGNAQAVQHLADFAKDTRADKRLVAAAVTALGKTGDRSVIGLMDKLLASKHVGVQQSAAIALGLLSPKWDDSSIELLFRCYKRARDLSLKGFTLTSIGRIGGPEAIKHLRWALARGTSSELPWAALGLGLAIRQAPDANAEAAMIEELKDCHNRSTQGAIAIALGLARSQKAIGNLVRLLEDDGDPTLRGYCAMALGMIGDRSALQPLRQALLEKTLPQVSTQAALALCLMNDRESILPLVDVLTTTNSDSVRNMAARSLVFLGDVRVVKRLIEYVNTQSTEEVTCMRCMEIVSKLVTGKMEPFMDRIAAGSNPACEFPIVASLLNFSI